MTKLVFIGVGLDKEKITGSLDKTLLTAVEMNSNWRALKDPLPKF